jgi:GNAT superfamily N-acetyltransferase
VTVQLEPVLRQATADDAAAIADLLIAYRADVPITIDPETQRELMAAEVRKDCLAGNGWVVTIGNVVAAGMIVRPDDREILYLVTGEQHRKHGLARKLIDQAKQIAIAAQWGTLLAKADLKNDRVLGLLDAEGFRRGEVVQGKHTWQHCVWRPE